MSEWSVLPITPKVGAEIQLKGQKYIVVSTTRHETDKFEECQIKIERAKRFLRKDAIYAIHKEPDGPVRLWPVS